MGESSSFFHRHQFLLYRLFSLTGLIPIGAYVVVHLATNAAILLGPNVYQDAVDQIHTLHGWALFTVEWLFIFLPLIFHAVIGLLIIKGAVPNTTHYPYVNNVRYTLQRVTAVIVLFFLIYHVWQMHAMAEPIGGGKFDPHRATSSASLAITSAWWVQALYAIGVLSAVYHLANGIWTAGITWGVWTTDAAQRRAEKVCAVFGLLIAALGIGAQIGAARMDIARARAIETVRIERQQEEQQRVEELVETERAGQAAGEPASGHSAAPEEASGATPQPAAGATGE